MTIVKDYRKDLWVVNFRVMAKGLGFIGIDFSLSFAKDFNYIINSVLCLICKLS